MKIFKYITYLVLFTGIFLNASCEVVDVTDIEPVYQVSEDKVITNLDQAQTVLHGTYGVLIGSTSFIIDAPGITSMLGLTMKPSSWGGARANAFYTNNVTSDNSYLSSIYSKMYFLINNANHVITKTELLSTNDPRKEEIIAEAKFLRAQAHFYLLRLWGEFYDENSSYGIVLKDYPISNASSQGRASVLESYNLILADLDYAIHYAPDFSNTFFASNLAAKALKSKVLLYKKDYSGSADLALEVLNSGERSLEAEYVDIFDKKIENPLEVIFQTPYDNLNDRNNKNFGFRMYFTVSSYYTEIMENDARHDASIYVSSRGSRYNNKFLFTYIDGARSNANTEYFIRLDEMYLIYAEAVLRGYNDVDASLTALNLIRERSNNPLFDLTEKSDILEAVRAEKVLELGGESGEEWFDLVRFHKEGDININDFKEISSDSKLILPLPYQTVQLSDGVMEQNPGY